MALIPSGGPFIFGSTPEVFFNNKFTFFASPLQAIFDGSLIVRTSE